MNPMIEGSVWFGGGGNRKQQRDEGINQRNTILFIYF